MSNAPPTAFRVAQYYQWYKQQSLELAPPFQRKPVWSMRNKSYLIDTILNNLPIPEVYTQVKTDKEGNTKYVVVDGQQRIRALLEFIEGEYSLLEDESQTYREKEFKDLPDGIKQEFWNYPIVTRELQTNSLEEVKEVFRRLNKYVVPLNDQELRNATYGGHFISLVNHIADKDDFWAENKIVTPNDIKRMIDAEFISELFIGMMHGIQQKNQTNIDGFYKMYDQSFPEKDEKRKEFESVENMITGIFGDDLVKTRWHGKPDFYSLFLAMYELYKIYHFPQDRYELIKNRLINFAVDVDNTKNSDKPTKDTLVLGYVESAEKQTTNKNSRQQRYEIVRQLIIPFLIAKDSRRDYNEEERRIAYGNSVDKKCAICGIFVEWNDFQLDHILPHSKGGKTELRNAQITHKLCNVKKSNKT